MQPAKSREEDQEEEHRPHTDPSLSNSNWCRSPAARGLDNKPKWVVGRAVEKSSGSRWAFRLTVFSQGPWHGKTVPRGGRGNKNRRSCKLVHLGLLFSISCDQGRKGWIFISQWDPQWYPLPSEGIISYCGKEQRHMCLGIDKQINYLPLQNMHLAYCQVKNSYGKKKEF